MSNPRALWADSRRLKAISVILDQHSGWDLETAGV